MNVIKRDGEIQNFSVSKIVRAMNKAFVAVTGDMMDKEFELKVTEYFTKFGNKSDKTVQVDLIHDEVEKYLFKKNLAVGKAYHDKRKERDDERQMSSAFTQEVMKKYNGSAIENQNANIDEMSFGGRKGEAESTTAKAFALRKMPKKFRKNHEGNMVYQHDLDSWLVSMHNCLTEPFDKMLANGVHTRQVDIRPANSVNTACQLVAVYFQLQSLQQFGGVSGSHLDWTMVPYIRKSMMKHYIKAWLRDTPEYDDLNILDMYFDYYTEIIYEDENDCIKVERNRWEDWVDEHKEMFFSTTGLAEEDFILEFDSNKFDKKYFNCALADTISEIKQAVEGLYHNLNSLQSRSGNQLPFTSINYGTCTSVEGRLMIKALLDASLKGTGKFGKTSIFPCGIFQYKKGVNAEPGTPNYDLKRLAIKSTAKRLYPNYANCDWSNQIAQVKQDRKVKEEVIRSLSEKEMDALFIMCTSRCKTDKNNKYISKLAEDLYINFYRDGHWEIDEIERPIEMFSTMGCRTANGYDINFRETYEANIKSVIETGELKYKDLLSGAQKDGRGNICPATIILPTLAMMARLEVEKMDDGVDEQTKELRRVEIFMDLLAEKMDDTKDSLIDRFNRICSQPAASAKFMYENGTMAGYAAEEGIVSAIKHGTLAIGQLGLAETLEILIGCDHTTDKGMKLAKRIESFYNSVCNEYKEKYHLNFGVYFTPAENLCFTAFKKWKAQYGDYLNVTYYMELNPETGEYEKHDKLYFTNSMHVPVYKQMSPFKKIEVESQLTGYSNAGCITYVEVDHAAIDNVDALEKLIDHGMEHDIPYEAINTPSDTCLDCGYQGHIGDRCPKCGSTKIERLARVTGYLTGHYPAAFNKGKVAEKEDRKVHKEIISF